MVVPQQCWRRALKRMPPSPWQAAVAHRERTKACSPSLLGTLRGPGEPLRAGTLSLHDSHRANTMHRPLAQGRGTAAAVGPTCGEEVLSELVWGAFHAPRSSR